MKGRVTTIIPLKNWFFYGGPNLFSSCFRGQILRKTSLASNRVAVKEAENKETKSKIGLKIAAIGTDFAELMKVLKYHYWWLILSRFERATGLFWSAWFSSLCWLFGWNATVCPVNGGIGFFYIEIRTYGKKKKFFTSSTEIWTSPITTLVDNRNFCSRDFHWVKVNGDAKNCMSFYQKEKKTEISNLTSVMKSSHRLLKEWVIWGR